MRLVGLPRQCLVDDVAFGFASSMPWSQCGLWVRLVALLSMRLVGSSRRLVEDAWFCLVNAYLPMWLVGLPRRLVVDAACGFAL